jgi:hypothetical protein
MVGSGYLQLILRQLDQLIGWFWLPAADPMVARPAEWLVLVTYS